MSSENPSSTKEKLQNLYKKAIESKLGAIVKIDESGDIVFKYGRLGLLLLPINDKDPSCFRLIDQVEMNSFGVDRLKVLEAVNIVNSKVKCVTQSVGSASV